MKIEEFLGYLNLNPFFLDKKKDPFERKVKNTFGENVLAKVCHYMKKEQHYLILSETPCL